MQERRMQEKFNNMLWNRSCIGRNVQKKRLICGWWKYTKFFSNLCCNLEKENLYMEMVDQNSLVEEPKFYFEGFLR